MPECYAGYHSGKHTPPIYEGPGAARMTSDRLCDYQLETPMTQQNEHRDQVTKAIFDTGYNYGAIHKAYLAAEGQLQPSELAAAKAHGSHACDLLLVIQRDAEQAEGRYPWGKAARKVADMVALAATEYTDCLRNSVGVQP